MKYSLNFVALAAFAVTNVLAAPSGHALIKRQTEACASAVEIAPGSNIFEGRKLHANSYYAAEIAAAQDAVSDETLKAQMGKVAEVGSFLWLDTIERAPLVAKALSETPCSDVLGVVIYDLPGRDCAAKASNGELKTGELARYKSEYIDPIVEQIKAAPNVAVALVIEPDSLPNLVTNSDLATCQASASEYREGVAYALKALNLPNVAMYIDAGHGGWLGWKENLQPGADELSSVFKAAGSPSQVMGIATNVAGWNAFSKVPGEFENTADGQYNVAHDESRYVNAICPLISAGGMPCHAIVDTGRNAVQGNRLEWGHWCNVVNSGFGARPTTETGNDLVDSFVWVKPGGESDGTSDTSAVRFDEFCGYADAYQPSPEAGKWNQDYFEVLLKNASPAF